MKANIDFDWAAYAHGGATTDEGHPLAWPLVASRISQQIENIVSAAGCDSYELFLTGTSNFRDSVATIRTYKGNRPSDKPHHYKRIREYLIKFRGATLIEGMEADDTVSILQYKNYDLWWDRRTKDCLPMEEWLKAETEVVLCSIDKDLDMCPGWHYNWIKDEKYWVSEVEGIRHFYKQLLTGDTVDNIPGLFGVGIQSTLVKRLRDYTLESDMYILVRAQYEKRFGSYWWKFLLENAQLLWMLREEPEYKVMTQEDYDKNTWTEFGLAPLKREGTTLFYDLPPVGTKILITPHESEIENRLECLEESRQSKIGESQSLEKS